MAQPALTSTGEALPRPEGLEGIVADWSSAQRAFKNVPWGKAMMWIFLLSDTFIFSSFLISYMTVRISTTVPWPNPSEYFAYPDRDHDLHPDQQQRDDGSGRQLRLSKRSRQNVYLPAAHRGTGRHIRGHAGFRVDQADRRRRGTSVGQPHGRGPVRLELLHDHGFPWHARVDRRDFPDYRGDQGVAGRPR